LLEAAQLRDSLCALAALRVRDPRTLIACVS